MDDSNFELVMEYADAVARSVYREEAKAIEELRKGIIEVSGKEEPYDIFICYKETDENGERTIDSVLAQDVYDALCEKGYRVFFSRITLEDKLGQEYEPYIFAALNSAKVMLAFGTSYDYYNAVWVKNEWSRYLQLMTTDKSKHLIPCYKDIDAYDMPKEFAKLQAQDMGKVGAIQDLLRGIEKLIGVKIEEPKETIVREVVNAGGANVDSLIKRGYMALEDKKWDEAKDFFNRALDINAECAEGYLGNALVWFKAVNIDDITNHFAKPDDFVEFEEYVTIFTDGDRKEHELIIGQNIVPYYLDEESLEKLFRFNDGYSYVTDETMITLEYEKRKLENKDLQRAYEYGDDKLKEEIDAIRTQIISMYEEAEAYIEKTNNANKEAKLSEYRSFLERTKEKIVELKKNAEEQREKDYQNAIKLFEEGEVDNALELFDDPKLADYKETRFYMGKCDLAIGEERQKKEREQLKQLEERRKKNTVRIIIIGIILAIFTAILLVVLDKIGEYKIEQTKKELVGYSFRGDAFHELNDKNYFDVLEINFLSEGLCNIQGEYYHYGDNFNIYKTTYQYQDVPYELEGGVFEIRLTWSDSILDDNGKMVEALNPDEPFVIHLRDEIGTMSSGDYLGRYMSLDGKKQ